jgi:hypothetical protein
MIEEQVEIKSLTDHFERTWLPTKAKRSRDQAPEEDREDE